MISGRFIDIRATSMIRELFFSFVVEV